MSVPWIKDLLRWVSGNSRWHVEASCTYLLLPGQEVEKMWSLWVPAVVLALVMVGFLIYFLSWPEGS